MPKPKIDITKMKRLLDEGKSQKEVAKVFSVTESAVSQKVKELNLAITPKIFKEAGIIIDKKINALDQLQKINNYANELLDLLMRWNKGDEGALQILESQVRKVRVGKTEKFVEEYKFKDPRELALRAMQEIRGQLNLQLDIFKTLYDIEAVREFQQEVLEAIGNANPELRERIIHNLQKRKAIRSAIKLD